MYRYSGCINKYYMPPSMHPSTSVVNTFLFKSMLNKRLGQKYSIYTDQVK